MGEYSKRIGEVGENVVLEFLKIIGWNNPQRNIDIPSADPEGQGKKTNGYDGYFHYRSSMISNTIENVIFSSKYSTEPYPKNPVTKFKDHYYDLVKVIDSFKKSEIKQQTLALHEMIDNHFDRGVLFWLNNSSSTDKDLITKLRNIELDKVGNHDGIFLVDNKRIEFIYDCITYILLKYKEYDIDFLYFNTGQNYDETCIRNGKIMPVQYINSSIIPLRAYKSGETVIILCTIEGFDKAELMKLMGVAKNIGWNSQGGTLICFPDYKEIDHGPQVEVIKNAFNDASFTSNLNVANYNNSILR